MFLDDIKQYKQELLKNKQVSKEELLERVSGSKREIRDFKSALTGDGLGLIAEIKMASPSKGDLSKFSLEELSELYSANAVNCISVLTEDKYFKGALENIEKVKEQFPGPVLQKDFVISDYQIYEGFIKGADCILLIAAMLSDEELVKYLGIVKDLGISALLEVHSEEEIIRVRGIDTVEIMGVNSRDLKTLKVNTDNLLDLVNDLPDNIIKVAESGIDSVQKAEKVYRAGYDALLIGESLVANDDPKGFIDEIKKIVR